MGIFNAFNKFSSSAGAAVGTLAGHLYGGPIASAGARWCVSNTVPVGGFLFNNFLRGPLIEHVAATAYGVGSTVGPVVGGATGGLVGAAAVYGATKGYESYNDHYYYTENCYKELVPYKDENDSYQDQYHVAELGTRIIPEEDREYSMVEVVLNQHQGNPKLRCSL